MTHVTFVTDQSKQVLSKREAMKFENDRHTDRVSNKFDLMEFSHTV